MEKSLVFGGRCTVLSMSYNPKRLLWRTLQQSLFEDLEQYLARYPKSGTMRNGVLYELQISGPLIKERDGFASRTLKTSDTILQMKKTFLPTPITSQVYKPIRPLCPSERAGTHGKSLPAAIGAMMLPTPTVNEAKNNPGTLSQWKRNDSLNVEASKMEGYTIETIGNRFLLNPQFVEEMMGFPIGWTDLEP